jgi:sugar phosphate isomerase/epimerase
MILYGSGDPIQSLRQLAPHVRQVHLKDATPAAIRGEWGSEVPLGEGRVDWAAFFQLLDEIGYAGALLIEREAGEDRVADVRAAAQFLASM